MNELHGDYYSYYSYWLFIKRRDTPFVLHYTMVDTGMSWQCKRIICMCEFFAGTEACKTQYCPLKTTTKISRKKELQKYQAMHDAMMSKKT
jgi:hypothetical protein